MTPKPHHNYRCGVHHSRNYTEIFNSDKEEFGGSNVLNTTTIQAEQIAWKGREYSIELQLPPLGCVIIKAV